ncbi:MAG TPA: hypothetical protein VM689_26955 [Aliidongia sp.]|nr:hypothetical protein [Aliidongia sp.]
MSTVDDGRPANGGGMKDDVSIRRATLQLVLADRTRTIDQVKRLYAVVMGLAVSSSFSDAYKVFKLKDIDSVMIGITVSEILTLISLIGLFYLGAERMLDSKYLDITVKPPPRRMIFLFDLCSLGLVAALFIALADTLPDPADLNAQMRPEIYFPKSQHVFLIGLMTLYVVDFIILLGQIIILYARKIIRRSPSHDASIRAHWCWILSNVICFGIFFPFVTDPSADAIVDLLGVNRLSILLVVVHTTRFLLDYNLAFSFYYPVHALPEADGLFLDAP